MKRAIFDVIFHLKEMAEHVTKFQLENLRRNRVGHEELIWIDDHLATCDTCREISLATLPATTLARLDHAIRFSPHLTYEQLEAYVDRQLSPDERLAVDEHIQGCNECGDELRDFEQLTSATTPQAANLSRLAHIRQMLFRPLAFTAAALVLTAVASLFWFSSKRDQIVTADLGREQLSNSTETVQSIEPELTNQESSAAETAPTESLQALIIDGGKEVGISSSGGLVGYDSLPSKDKNLIKLALVDGRLEVPDMSDLKGPSGSLMGDGGIASTFRVLSPVAKVLDTGSPTFSWEAVPGAEKYVVEIFDTSFTKVQSSGPLKTNSWRASLPRGKTFLWQVTATKDGTDLKAPRRPAPEARFRLISAKTSSELAQVRNSHPNSHLLLAITLARAGLIDEAIREIEALSKQNPKSSLPQKLLRQLRRSK